MEFILCTQEYAEAGAVLGLGETPLERGGSHSCRRHCPEPLHAGHGTWGLGPCLTACKAHARRTLSENAQRRPSAQCISHLRTAGYRINEEGLKISVCKFFNKMKGTDHVGKSMPL